MAAIGYLIVGFITGWIIGVVASFVWLKSMIGSLPKPEVEESL